QTLPRSPAVRPLPSTVTLPVPAVVSTQITVAPLRTYSTPTDPMTMTTMTQTVEGSRQQEGGAERSKIGEDQRSVDDETEQKMKRTDSWASMPQPWSCCMNTRACPGTAYNPTPIEHVANTLSHAVGIVVSLFYMSAMLSASHRSLQFYIALVYGVCTTLLFLMSTVYHYYEMLYRDARLRPTLRYYLHITDRTAIYLFIAASYTPWLTLRHCGLLGLNAKWWTWAAALGGMAYQIAFHERYKRLELAIYIFVAVSPALAVLTMNDWSGLDWMAAGGAIYLVGVVFFKLDGRVPFAHAIWHLHVLAAAAMHQHTVLSVLLGPDANNPVPIID
ncbi:hypothetical protein PENTCL1PPCAC_20987, partial [Pristionchus entomophagus]